MMATKPNNSEQGVQAAKHPVRCQSCGHKIARGEPMREHSRYGKGDRVNRRWEHVRCPAESNGHSGGQVSPELDRIVREKVQRILALEKRVAELESNRPVVHQLREPNGDTREIEGAVHPVFERVVELARARKHIFLPGPSGCGKSHLARQVGAALGLRFGCISCSAGMSESQLVGRMVPKGEQGQFEFLTTEFLECYENGGVFLFDELDAADSNVLLVINSALANGHMSVPSRHDNPVAKRHPDFVCIAAANTWGHGADRQYVGRNELDESTLDRFRIGVVPMSYDGKLERQLCPNQELLCRLKLYRRQIERNRLQRIVSTRFIAEAYEMVTRWGWSLDRVDEQLFAGWREDEIAKVKGAQ